ncbi:MAG: hypothetical protein U0354_14675 [Candidatus Sericytochromatia bacterium]
MNTLKKVFNLVLNLFNNENPKTIVLYRNDEFLPEDNLARIYLKIK